MLTGLADQAGVRFANRVVLIAADSLGNVSSGCQLTGADVIVLTPSLPSAAGAAAAQEKLIAAGAARVSVLGPEATQAEIGQLVSDGLGGREVSGTLSGAALFGDDSAVLRSTATRVLTPLVSLLRQSGAIAVINGYASAPGDARHNQQLSENRAAAVAAFFEAHGISAAALLVIGHGATGFIAPGASPDNRRVVVVVEEPRPRATGARPDRMPPRRDRRTSPLARMPGQPGRRGGRADVAPPPPSRRGSGPRPARPAWPTARRYDTGSSPAGRLAARKAASAHRRARRIRRSWMPRTGRLTFVLPPLPTAS